MNKHCLCIRVSQLCVKQYTSNININHTSFNTIRNFNRSFTVGRRWKSYKYAQVAGKGEPSTGLIDGFGAWDSATDLPIIMDASIAHGKPIPKVLASSVGVSRLKGKRVYQEDQYGIEQLTPNILYLAVYDGHGGAECSKFCQQQMPRHIMYWLGVLAARGQLDLKLVLHNAFLETNNAFARWVTSRIKGEEIDASGSTATVCLIRDSMHLVVASCGDSRALFCRVGGSRKLTTDHTTSLITEKIRIKDSGGRVTGDRVNDRLAMTRSIGDLELKKFGVIAEPEIRELQINHSRDAFLVLTTDGVNAVMSDQEIVDIVKQAEDPTQAAHLVTDTAGQYSSEDNTTVIVVPLGSWGKYSAAATIFHSFGKSFTSSSRFS